MASPTLRRLCLLAAPLGAFALQVTPDSPCAAVCQDADGLDHSDPNSSNTQSSDITCEDSAFRASGSTAKWKNCMSCLQDSAYSRGGENDQMWFLYNSRYALSACVFGLGNATGAGGSPCVTPPACGGLKRSLEQGITGSEASSQYGYCSTDGGAMTGPSYETCLSCIEASGNNQYVANYLVALEAGCLQKPAPGSKVGLNASVFSTTLVEIVRPSNPAGPSSRKQGGLTGPMIAVVAICSIAFLLVVAALLFIRSRRRKNRLARREAAEKFRRQTGPQSPLSFQCRTHLGPLSPKFFPGYDESTATDGRPPTERGSSLNITPGRGSRWTPQQGGSPSFQSLSTIAERDVEFNQQKQHQKQHGPTTSLYSIDTSAAPLAPSAAHCYGSPSSAFPYRSSPSSPFPDPTPTSTTSVRSTAQLLPRGSPSTFSSSWSPASPADKGWPLAPAAGAGVGVGGVLSTKKESGAPVERTVMDATFPPPPGR